MIEYFIYAVIAIWMIGYLLIEIKGVIDDLKK